MQETQEIQVQSLGWEDSLEKKMATHSSILAWEIPEREPGRLQSMGPKSGTGLSTQAHHNRCLEKVLKASEVLQVLIKWQLHQYRSHHQHLSFFFFNK